MTAKKYIKGYKHHDLVLVKIVGIERENNIWKCRCKCGRYRNLSVRHFHQASHCGNRIHHRSSGKGNHRWNGVGDLDGLYFSGLRTKAKKKKIKFTVTKEYLWDLFLKQNKTCPYTGYKLKFKVNCKEINNHSKTTSLDRINSSKGYIKGNVEWVHKHVNIMKNVYSKKYFLKLIKDIYKNKIAVK